MSNPPALSNCKGLFVAAFIVILLAKVKVPADLLTIKYAKVSPDALVIDCAPEPLKLTALPFGAKVPELVQFPPTAKSPPDWFPKERLPLLATFPPTVSKPTPEPGLP